MGRGPPPARLVVDRGPSLSGPPIIPRGHALRRSLWEGKQGREKMIQLVREKGAAAVAEQMMPKMLAPGAEQSRPGVTRALAEIMGAQVPLTIEHALAAMRDRPDFTSDLPSIATPTLVIVGEDDAITPPDGAQAMSRAIPHARCVVIRGAGHMSPMEQPQQVSDALRRFATGLA